jgi:hypothetical protein
VTRPAVPDRFLLKCTSICWIGTAIGTRRTGPRSTARGRTPPDNGEWRLTIAEKRRILLAHIYGDIDPQAVEARSRSRNSIAPGREYKRIQAALFMPTRITNPDARVHWNVAQVIMIVPSLGRLVTFSPDDLSRTS